jgi:hypothetical protein
MGDSLGLDMPSTTQAFLIPVKLARALETCIPAVGEVAGFAAGSAFARQSSASCSGFRRHYVTFGMYVLLLAHFGGSLLAHFGGSLLGLSKPLLQPSTFPAKV